MIITIAGEPGSGKTTIAEMLAKHLGWPEYYVGAMRREAAKKKNMTLEEYNKLGEQNPTTDKEVDEWQKRLGQKEDNFIIQGRTSWYFIPNSIKIYISVDPRVGAKRIFSQLQLKERIGETRDYATVEDIVKSNKERIASDNKRYRQYYGIEAYDKKNFDLVVDSTDKSADEVFDEIVQYVEQKITD